MFFVYESNPTIKLQVQPTKEINANKPNANFKSEATLANQIKNAIFKLLPKSRNREIQQKQNFQNYQNVGNRLHLLVEIEYQKSSI